MRGVTMKLSDAAMNQRRDMAKDQTKTDGPRSLERIVRLNRGKLTKRNKMIRCACCGTSQRYRIVTDNYCGFEVQVKRWWCPFWVQCHGEHGPANTWPSVEKAEEFAKRHALGKEHRFGRQVVKYL